jgi:hypothetical protein
MQVHMLRRHERTARRQRQRPARRPVKQPAPVFGYTRGTHAWSLATDARCRTGRKEVECRPAKAGGGLMGSRVGYSRPTATATGHRPVALVPSKPWACRDERVRRLPGSAGTAVACEHYLGCAQCLCTATTERTLALGTDGLLDAQRCSHRAMRATPAYSEVGHATSYTYVDVTGGNNMAPRRQPGTGWVRSSRSHLQPGECQQWRRLNGLAGEPGRQPGDRVADSKGPIMGSKRTPHGDAYDVRHGD